jgi:hypothetical protein
VEAVKQVFWKFLVWLDLTVNDKWFKGRWETISGRLLRRGKQGKCPLCVWVCQRLEEIDPGHCARAYVNDRKRNPNLPI